MKIGMVAPIWYPIPPPGYGGIELIVSLLTEELVARGHDVTLFAAGESKTKAKLSASLPKAPSEDIGQTYPDLIHALNAYLKSDDFDIIHDHSGIIGPALGAFVDRPVIHTLHGPATGRAVKFYQLIAERVYLNSISEYQRRAFSGVRIARNIYNAVDLAAFDFQEKKQDYLLFIGRMSPEKGADLAIKAAKKVGLPLKLVSKMVEPGEKFYYKEKVEPLLDESVEVIGQVDFATKVELFAHAKCTLFPIQWPEPFGLVMIESMATGTPVVAMRNGAVPEVIVDGETGYIVDTLDEFAAAITRSDKITPAACRRRVRERFSVPTMVDAYEEFYNDVARGALKVAS